MSKENLYAFDTNAAPQAKNKAWKILIVDDDPDIHSVTKMALSFVEFENRPLELISAFTSIEARQLIAFHPDIAVILLDMVIENESAGLDLVKFIREELRNNAVRIILRTGQKATLPESKTVTEYDINDYKNKAELTSQKLFTSVIIAIRGFRDFKAAYAIRNGLDVLTSAARKLGNGASIKEFFSDSLNWLGVLLFLERNSYYMPINGFAARQTDSGVIIQAVAGDFKKFIGSELSTVVGSTLFGTIKSAVSANTNVLDGSHMIVIIDPIKGDPAVLVIELTRALEDWEKSVITLYSSNISALYYSFLSRGL